MQNNDITMPVPENLKTLQGKKHNCYVARRYNVIKGLTYEYVVNASNMITAALNKTAYTCPVNGVCSDRGHSGRVQVCAGCNKVNFD